MNDTLIEQDTTALYKNTEIFQLESQNKDLEDQLLAANNQIKSLREQRDDLTRIIEALRAEPSPTPIA